MKKLNILTLTALVALTSLCGCKTMEFSGPNWINQEERPRLLTPLNFSGKEKEVPIGTAQKMAVIWKDTVMQKPGTPSTRGFGGRVYFYDSENKAIKVNGEMIVYGFDTEAEKSQADKKFVFESGDLDSHYGETDLGHSYSFWIPWDKNGNDRMAVTLIPIFKNSDGNIVKGGQTVNVLPGPAPTGKKMKSMAGRGRSYIGKEADSENAEIKLAGAEASPNSSNNVWQNGIVREEESTGMRTTTINLPRNVANRIASLPAETGPVNTVRTSKRSIGVEDTTTDLRQQVPTQTPVAKNHEERRSRYPSFGDAATDSMDESSSKPVRVFGKPQPFQ